MTTATRNAKRRARIGDTSPETVQAVAIYARVSTEDQTEKETITNQLDFLRRFANLHELTIAGEYVDDGIGGRVPFGDRPEGRRLLLDAEAERFGVVLIYNVKRLGRRLRVVLDAHDALQRHDVAIRSGTEPIDTSTPTGKLVFHMLGGFAEFDTDERVEVMSLGRDRVARNGHYTGGPIPLGYDLDAEGRLTPSARMVLQLGMTEAAYVADLFARIANGETTLNSEANRLTALGVPGYQRYPTGRVIERTGRWGMSSLAKIVHNPTYKGAGILNSRHGDVIRPAPSLVDEATWQLAQESLLRNKRLSTKNAKNVYLLRGLITCGNCGRSYTGTTKTRRSTRTGEMVSTRMYRCTSNFGRASGCDRCESKMLPADWLEDAVWQECRRFIMNPGDALEEARRKLRERMADASRFDAQRRRTLDALADKETERERILTMYRRGKIDADEAEAQLDAIAHEAGQLREDLESMRAQSALVDIQEAHLTESAALLGRLRDELPNIDANNDPTRKREIMERYVRKITVDTRRIGPRKLDADVRLALRLKPDAIAIDNIAPWPGSTRPALCR